MTPVSPNLPCKLPLEGVIEKSGPENGSFGEFTVAENCESVWTGNLVKVGNDDDVADFGSSRLDKGRKNDI